MWRSESVAFFNCVNSFRTQQTRDSNATLPTSNRLTLPPLLCFWVPVTHLRANHSAFLLHQLVRLVERVVTVPERDRQVKAVRVVDDEVASVVSLLHQRDVNFVTPALVHRLDHLPSRVHAFVCFPLVDDFELAVSPIGEQAAVLGAVERFPRCA